jgi:biopolymer transport protein ExbD
MADFQPAASGNRRRKLSTPRIDLTPMVDLGFLLITFFMYTTTMAKPKVMELQMPYVPHEHVDSSKIPAESTLILLPTSGHRVAYYRGAELADESLAACSFAGNNSLRKLIEEETKRVTSLPATFSKEAHKLHVLIKPDTSSAYEDMVSSLDEMAIAEVPYYTIMHIGVDEQSAIQKYFQSGYGK